MSKDFYTLGFYQISEDKAIQNICGHGSITLNYNAETRPILSVKMMKNGETISNVVMNQRIPGGYNINFYINEASTFNLNIYGNKGEKNTYDQIVSVIIKCNSPPSPTNYYPEFNIFYNKLDNIELIKPLHNNLIQGNKYDFEIKASGFGSFYLNVDHEFIHMYRSSDSYKADNVLIHGNSVTISCEQGTMTYGSIIEYSTTGETVQFPSTFYTSLNIRLEEPLASSLTRGESVTFKILCETDETFRLLYKNNADSSIKYYAPQNFNKEGNTYSITSTIESSVSYTTLDICNMDDYGYCYSIYSYELTSS